MNIYQHFRPEEHEFIDQVVEWKRIVEDNYFLKLTDFLDPRQQQIVYSIIGESADVRCQFFGGLETSERKRAIIYPDYSQVNKDDFQLCLLDIQYPSKFVTIEHPQVLGSLMSLGLKREKFGDILFQNEKIQIVVAKEIYSFIQSQLTRVGQAKVSVKEIPFSDIINNIDLWNEEMTTLSSMRLDSLISALYNLSRQKAQLLIEKGLVKVNFRTIEKVSFEIAEYDLISVRGYGRSKIITIEGKTKKDKWRITVGKQK